MRMGRNPLFSEMKVLLNFFQKIAVSKGSEATEVWVPAQTSGAQAPFFGGLLGLSAEARFARRPLSLPCGRGVGDPSPQAPPRQAGSDFLFSQPKVLLNFFQKIAVSKGRAFGRSSHCEPQRSVSERNRRRRLLARRSSEILYPVKRVFRVNCLAA